VKEKRGKHERLGVPGLLKRNLIRALGLLIFFYIKRWITLYFNFKTLKKYYKNLDKLKINSNLKTFSSFNPSSHAMRMPKNIIVKLS